MRIPNVLVPGAIFALLSIGCGAGQVKVVSRGVFAQKPSHVATYVSISEDNRALLNLSADHFRIYEDEQLIPPTNSRQVLLDKQLAQAHYAVVLVDQSAATDEEVRQELANALTFFVDRVRKTQPIVIYAFDGRKELRLIAELPKQDKAKSPKDQFFAGLNPADTSRNLNGAIVDGIGKLDEFYRQTKNPLRAGTLIVFAGGPDFAGRVKQERAQEVIDESEYSIITVGVGDSAPELTSYGRDGFVDGHSLQTLSMAFEEAGYLVEDDYQRHYLLAYCSPARAGERSLRIEVVKDPAEEFASGSSGEIGRFSADGFTEGCDPTMKPRFDKKK